MTRVQIGVRCTGADSHDLSGLSCSVAAVAAGRSLTLEAAVDEALALIGTITVNPRQSPGIERCLTRRESEVAALVARGMTNRQIAAELVLTESTAAKHVEHIRDKLGFTSRFANRCLRDWPGLAWPGLTFLRNT